jgi:hypothetical protein
VLAWLSLAPTRELAVRGASRARNPRQHGEAQQGKRRQLAGSQSRTTGRAAVLAPTRKIGVLLVPVAPRTQMPRSAPTHWRCRHGRKSSHWAAAVRLNAVCRPCRGTEFGSGSRGGTTVPAMRCPVKLPVNVVAARPATRRSQQRLMSRQSGETCGYERARTTESIGKTTDAALLLPPARWP